MLASFESKIEANAGVVKRKAEGDYSKEETKFTRTCPNGDFVNGQNIYSYAETSN